MARPIYILESTEVFHEVFHVPSPPCYWNSYETPATALIQRMNTHALRFSYCGTQTARAPRSALVLFVSVFEGVRRTTSPPQVSTLPSGEIPFLFIVLNNHAQLQRLRQS